MRSPRALALVGTVAFVAACSDTPSAPVAPVSSVSNPAYDISNASPNAGDNPDRHIFELNGSNGAKAAGGGGGGGTGIFYHGGPVLRAATNVASVYWATSAIYSGGPAVGTSGPGSSDASGIGFFLNHLGGTPYFNINTTYTDGSGAAIANVVNYTQYWANGSSVPADGATVTDAQMVAMLQSGFNYGALSYDPNTLYAIFTAGKVNLGGGFGSQYCAYHTHGTVTINGASRTVLYAAMPYDAAYPSGCAGITTSANGDYGADVEVNTLAHETEETTTDLMGNAWYDRRGYENADKCAWTWGTTYTAANGMKANMNIGGRDYLIQQNWINAGSGGCRLSWP